MPMERVAITPELRQLIRFARTSRHPKMSQRAAAEKAGSFSEIWWRQIEGGHAEYATADSLARMCYAVGVTADQLRRIGQDHIAEVLDARHHLLDAPPVSSMEAHLMATPGLTSEQRAALVVMAKALRGNV